VRLLTPRACWWLQVAELEAAMTQLEVDMARTVAHRQRLERVRADISADLADKTTCLAKDNEALAQQQGMAIASSS
jgi:hypothetical protein